MEIHRLKVSQEVLYTTEIVISGLNTSASYDIQVAAVNSAGVGVYSNVISTRSLGIFPINGILLLL